MLGLILLVLIAILAVLIIGRKGCLMIIVIVFVLILFSAKGCEDGKLHDSNSPKEDGQATAFNVPSMQNEQ